jgi:hypothetical protein
MVDLGGYVIILVETRDKKIKLYGMFSVRMKFLYCTTITKGLLLLLAALVCECGYGQVLIGSAPVVWEAGREYVCAAERCLDVSLSLSLSVPQHLLQTIDGGGWS